MGFVEGNVTLDGGTGNVEDVNITAGTNLTYPDLNGDYLLPLIAGTYDVVASLDGYETVTEYDVQVTPTQTVTINFVLTYLQAPENLGLILPGVEIANGLIKTRNGFLQTSREKVFAGGDLVRGASTVVAAVADGMKAAREIDNFLSGR